MSKTEIKNMGVKSLPASMGEVIAETEKSDLMRQALGDHTFERFIALKRHEWDDLPDTGHALRDYEVSAGDVGCR
jgi:glutamine synthetase